MSLEQAQRPFITHVLNGIGKSLRALKIPLYELKAEALCESATKNLKLSDFGDPTFYEGMHCLLNSIDKEANLNFLGRMLMQKILIAFL
ncbi:MAG: hypothetical protein KDJ52_10335 [Anaerolineae bacterium]|nr:hypothetical protein [Anaerolineae bacterium]